MKDTQPLKKLKETFDSIFNEDWIFDKPTLNDGVHQ